MASFINAFCVKQLVTDVGNIL